MEIGIGHKFKTAPIQLVTFNTMILSLRSLLLESGHARHTCVEYIVEMMRLRQKSAGKNAVCVVSIPLRAIRPWNMKEMMMFLNH